MYLTDILWLINPTLVLLGSLSCLEPILDEKTDKLSLRVLEELLL